jgi:hypothetical protein
MSDSGNSEKHVCKDCGEECDLSAFSLAGLQNRRGERYRLQRCKRCRSKVMLCVYRLRKLAGQPSPRCESCHRLGQVSLDHDHATGEFKGWLCRRCNIGLGKLGDDIASIRRALTYLIAYITRSTASSSECDGVCGANRIARRSAYARDVERNATRLISVRAARGCATVNDIAQIVTPKQNGSYAISARPSDRPRPAARSVNASGGHS